MKLNVKAMAFTGAIVWGVGLFLLTWWIILFDGASTDEVFIGKVYRGYQLTPQGSFIGLLWKFQEDRLFFHWNQNDVTHFRFFGWGQISKTGDESIAGYPACREKGGIHFVFTPNGFRPL